MKKQTFLTRGWSDITRWSRAHPVKATSFTLLLVVLGVLGCVLEEIGSLVAVLVLLAIGYAVWVWMFTRDSKRILAGILAAALLLNPQPLRAAPLAIGAAFVLIVGGIIGCRIAKKCDKISKAITNSWPEEFRIAGATSEAGAVFSWTEEGYCLEELTAPPTPTVTTLFITVESASNCTVTVSAATGHDLVQTWAEFQEELAGHGLVISGSPQSSSFERDRQPCGPESVPLSFDFATRTIKHADGGILVTVERSSDLRQWQPLLRMDTAAGSRLLVEDASSGGQAFYRVCTR